MGATGTFLWRGAAAAALIVLSAGVGPTLAADSQPSASTSVNVSDDAVIARIDALVRQSWEAHGVRPSRRATDLEWRRRVYLDVLGRIPRVDELDGAGGKQSRAGLVDRLLGQEYADEYAQNWKAVWTNVLIGRTGGQERRSLTSRAGMMDYLEGCFQANKPYDLMVRDLLTATGESRPGKEGYNGAVNFLIGKMDEGGVQATAKSAQIFLGMTVQCTQCHDHPFNDYRQNQFWELNAFFRQAAVEAERMDGPRVQSAELVDRDFAGEGKMAGVDQRREIFLEVRNGQLVDRDLAAQQAAPVFYELRNGQVQAAYPAFVDGRSLAEKFEQRGPEFGNSGRLEQVDRRGELADFVLGSEHLEQAAVNRMWARFFGYGLSNPIDDLGPHNPPTHPELLAELAKAFRDCGFDMKRLVRWIVLSEAYGLSSQGGAANKEDNPSAGKPALFSRFYLRQMEPEQLYESLLAATRADAGLKRFDRELMKNVWLEQFNTASGNDEATESTTFNGSIPQALMMMNGELVRRACRTDAGGFLDRVANDAELSDREKIDYLYRAALGRLPGKDEKAVCNELLASRGGDVVQTLADVWWAVLNSNEFILVH